MHQLNMKFPKNMTYDYTRVISDPIPSLADPDPVSDVTEYIEYIKDKAARARWKEIVETDLQSAKDLIKVDNKKQEIDKELLDLIANYERMKKEIVPKFEDLKIELEIDSDKDFAKYRKDRIEQQQAKAMEAAKQVNDVKDDYDYDSETEEEEEQGDNDDDGRVERGGGGD